MALFVLVSITAQAEQEPAGRAGTRLIERAGLLDKALLAARRGEGDRTGSAANGASAEFDPSHTMSPVEPSGAGPAPEGGPVSFSDGATPSAPLEFALNSSSPAPSDGVLVVVETDPPNRPPRRRSHPSTASRTMPR